jgi:hypothetical protein
VRVAEEERLFEVPRVAVEFDDADPDVLRLAFSGTVVVDRTDPDDVAFYNSLPGGSVSKLTVSVYAAGAQNRHKDGIVTQTKAIVVDGVER